jgi:hypothetical protein
LDDTSGVAVVDPSARLRGETGLLSGGIVDGCLSAESPLAPGVLLRAAPMSGAGAGKGLLARCMCIIAFGRDPHAVTAGAQRKNWRNGLPPS